MPNLSNQSSGHPNGPTLAVRGSRVITPGGERRASIHIRQGRITNISAFDDIPVGCSVYEAGESVVMPGLVDTHVHINEPGRTEWEGFSSATQAAAAGGVTTLIEMPLNSIPATTTAASYEQKVNAATDKLRVNVGFWGGVVPGNAAELRSLWDAGVFGFKCFLVPSGVPEFARVTEPDLRVALPELAALGAPLLAHAELPGPIDAAAQDAGAANAPRNYATWLASRPRESEDQAIALLLRLSREFNALVHIVHLASSDAIPQLQSAKSGNPLLSVETCPHYLT